MAGKFVYFALLLCVSQAVFGATVEDARKEAQKRIAEQDRRLSDMFGYIRKHTMRHMNTVNVIARSRLNEAVRIQYQTADELEKLAQDGLKHAKNPESTKCIKDGLRTALSTYDNFFDKKFFDVYSKSYSYYSGERLNYAVHWNGAANQKYRAFDKRREVLVQSLASATSIAQIESIAQEIEESTEVVMGNYMIQFVRIGQYDGAFANEIIDAIKKIKTYSSAALNLFPATIEECLLL